MKKNIVSFLFLIMSFAAFSQNFEKTSITKKDLIEFIAQSRKEGKINKDPVIVLDEKIISNLKEINPKQKFLSELKLINMGNKEIVQIYGAKAINGVVFIQSNTQYNTSKQGGDVLFFIGEKEISENDLKKIDPNSIKEISVFKSKDEIKKYTDKVCAGIVVVTLHKKSN